MSSRGEGDVSVDVLESLAYTISIHALRMEGDGFPSSGVGDGRRISIHALRVEGDLLYLCSQNAEIISIHALRVEGDSPVPKAESR